MTRRRLDAELVRRDLARSRQHASELIAGGRVRVNRMVATKPATQVEDSAPIVVDAGESTYVSRGAHKLLGPLAAFGLQVRGREALDAGASTGGFTQVLLEAGVNHVVAVDVGYGQLAWSLQRDPRVTVLDRTNVRHLTGEHLPYAPDLVVADLSFISLTKVLPALSQICAPDADFVVLVKPQFEVGKGHVGKGGVVRDPALHGDAVRRVASAAAELGYGVAGLCRSPLPGPSGNIEFVMWLRRGAPAVEDAAVEEVVTP
ncbi:MAG: TlyA family RNA methyltransferase [Micrococcales bacterium]|nr:TlyA family RNA methyltransferase [Micrococcales bacterium]